MSRTPTMPAAEFRRNYAQGRTPAYCAQSDAATAKAERKPKAPPPPEPIGPGGYGIATYAQYAGVRFVAHDITPALAQELAAVCARHGVRPASTAHFITESAAH